MRKRMRDHFGETSSLTSAVLKIFFFFFQIRHNTSISKRKILGNFCIILI